MSQDKTDAEVAGDFAFVMCRLASEAHKIATDVRYTENVMYVASVLEEEFKRRASEMCKKISERKT